MWLLTLRRTENEGRSWYRRRAFVPARVHAVTRRTAKKISASRPIFGSLIDVSGALANERSLLEKDVRIKIHPLFAVFFTLVLQPTHSMTAISTVD